MSVRVAFATDSPDHGEAVAILAWLEDRDDVVAEAVPLRNAARADADVVWIHGVGAVKLEALRGDVAGRILRGGLLLTGGAAVLPAAAGVDGRAPNDVGRNRWSHEKDELYLFRSFSAFPHIRGHASYRGHGLFSGLGTGTYTWRPAEGEEFGRFTYVQPQWPDRARVVAVERSYIHINADRATIWEYGDGPVTLCIGAYTPLHAAESPYRSHLDGLMSNAIRYVAGRLEAGEDAGEWVRPEPGAAEDRSVPVPELPIMKEPLGDLEFRLRASGPAGPDEPFTLAGRRALVTGGEARGVDEVWTHPLRVLSGLRAAGAEAEAATVTPIGVQRQLRIGDALVTERVVVPRESPGCIVEWYSRNAAVTLDLEWTVDLRLMWPYPADATGPLRWRSTSRGVVVAGRGDDRAAFGFSEAPSSLVVEDASDGDASRVRVRASLSLAPRSSARLAVAGGVGGEMVGRALSAANRTVAVARAREGYTERLMSDRLAVEAPDPAVGQAVDWAKYRLASYLVETPGIGRSLVAGYWGSSEGWFGDGRPGYAWYFGRDAVWTAFASLGVGDFGAARDVLAFLGRHQDLTGKILHECTTSGSVHYDSADATPLYLLLMARYHAWTGDTAFVQSEWGRVLKAYEFCLSTDRDLDGLIENTGVGHGWIEFGRLGRGDVTIYNASIWAAALNELGDSAEALGDPGSAVELRQAGKRAEAAVRDLFRDPETGDWALNLRREGEGWERNMAQTVMQAVPILLGVLRPESVESWLDAIAGDDFTAPWGVRMLPISAPDYNPESYHGGAVWPLYTGWVSWAEYAAGRPESGYRHWMMNVEQAFWRERGAWDEVLHGTERRGRGVCPDQAWSTAMAVLPLVHGLLGVEPDATRGRMVLRPRLPAAWDRLRVSNITMADSALTFSYRRDEVPGGHRHRIVLRQERGAAPVRVVLEPELPGSAVRKASVDGEPAALDDRPAGDRVRVPLQVVTDHERVIEIETES